MIQSVLPGALAVSDMERSLAFYCGLLGFRVSAELPNRAERERLPAETREPRIAGYGELARRFLLRCKDSPEHPGFGPRPAGSAAPSAAD